MKNIIDNDAVMYYVELFIATLACFLSIAYALGGS